MLAAAASPLWIAHLPWKLTRRGSCITSSRPPGLPWDCCCSAWVGSAAGAWPDTHRANDLPPREPICPALMKAPMATLIGLLTIALSLLWCHVDPEGRCRSGDCGREFDGRTAGRGNGFPRMLTFRACWSTWPARGLLSWDRGNLATLVETNALCFAAPRPSGRSWICVSGGLVGQIA